MFRHVVHSPVLSIASQSKDYGVFDLMTGNSGEIHTAPLNKTKRQFLYLLIPFKPFTLRGKLLRTHSLVQQQPVRLKCIYCILYLSENIQYRPSLTYTIFHYSCNTSPPPPPYQPNPHEEQCMAVSTHSPNHVWTCLSQINKVHQLQNELLMGVAIYVAYHGHFWTMQSWYLQ